MKRRKKSPEKGTSEATPAPLQPAYFDVGVPPEAPAAEARRAEPAPEQPQTREADEPQTGREELPGRSGDGVRRRRRRRGGRGRGRGQARAAVAAPPGETPVEFAPEEAAPVAVAAHEATAAATAHAPASPSSPVRAPKGVVVLAIGLPGSGKSSWFKRHNITALSSDLLRALLFDNPTEQRFQDLVFSNLRSMLKARLIARRPLNYVDATNLTPHERHSWIKLAKDFGYEVHAVFFDVPVEVCLERNQRRQRVVPEDVMRRMAAKLRPPTFEEGFAKITVVRVKHKS
ncbi:MAG: ATP-binding protein [Acidobacteriia bacterium]|nr:ATP-binding protein [Terriglobia bacterium]